MGRATKSKRGHGVPASRGDAIKTRIVAFRLTEAEHFRLMDKAARSGLSPADYARTRALAGIARKKKPAQQTDALFGEATREIFHEVRRQGINLNQIAHHCNRHQVPPPPATQALAGRLLELWQMLLKQPAAGA